MYKEELLELSELQLWHKRLEEYEMETDSGMNQPIQRKILEKYNQQHSET